MNDRLQKQIDAQVEAILAASGFFPGTAHDALSQAAGEALRAAHESEDANVSRRDVDWLHVDTWEEKAAMHDQMERQTSDPPEREHGIGPEPINWREVAVGTLVWLSPVLVWSMVGAAVWWSIATGWRLWRWS